MSSSSPESPASNALLSAALGGLLCVAACSGQIATTPDASSVDATADTTPLDDARSPVDDAAVDADDASSPVDDATVDADAATNPYECDGGVVPDAGITSSQVISMTLQDFTDLCTQKGGVLEIEPHCGGLNSCRGLSYDTGTTVLTEHSCRDLNTCAGYSCIICN
jgi:hypothetical protein